MNMQFHSWQSNMTRAASRESGMKGQPRGGHSMRLSGDIRYFQPPRSPSCPREAHHLCLRDLLRTATLPGPELSQQHQGCISWHPAVGNLCLCPCRDSPAAWWGGDFGHSSGTVCRALGTKSWARAPGWLQIPIEGKYAKIDRYTVSR